MSSKIGPENSVIRNIQIALADDGEVSNQEERNIAVSLLATSRDRAEAQRKADTAVTAAERANFAVVKKYARVLMSDPTCGVTLPVAPSCASFQKEARMASETYRFASRLSDSVRNMVLGEEKP